MSDREEAERRGRKLMNWTCSICLILSILMFINLVMKKRSSDLKLQEIRHEIHQH